MLLSVLKFYFELLSARSQKKAKLCVLNAGWPLKRGKDNTLKELSHKNDQKEAAAA